MINCAAANLYEASFTVRETSETADQNKNIKFLNCRSNRNRGRYGDAFYAESVRNVIYDNCRAYDFTRTGFAYEGDDPNNEAADLVNISNCYAEYAHDNHSAENSCGYWVKTAQEVNITGCHAVNTVGGYALLPTDTDGLSD